MTFLTGFLLGAAAAFLACWLLWAMRAMDPHDEAQESALERYARRAEGIE